MEVVPRIAWGSLDEKRQRGVVFGLSLGVMWSLRETSSRTGGRACRERLPNAELLGLTDSGPGSRILFLVPGSRPKRLRYEKGWVDMATVLKHDEIDSFRHILENLRARLRGDLDQMTDEALRRNMQSGSGNLSNVPLHMADVGTENYDQEFTLGLIQNEQGTLELINEALTRLEKGKFGSCVECGDVISKSRLQAIPYTRHCIDCARIMENGG
jgi:DnaK suppressor protein